MPNQHVPDLLCSTFPRRASISRALKHLANMASEIVAKDIRFQAVEPPSSVRDRLRNEGVDCKLGRVNPFTTVADAIDNLVLNVTGEQTRT
jgi:hypothetical protein